jgi:hypothetical protein
MQHLLRNETFDWKTIQDYELNFGRNPIVLKIHSNSYATIELLIQELKKKGFTITKRHNINLVIFKYTTIKFIRSAKITEK